MKVLFAVSNEEISESIIKLYQKEYREIISGKNVYYFNAIIKELQRDQTYDRIVISEDLEPYSSNNFDLIDKFLFEQLDKISDEAISNNGTDIPIIFIATDRRSKSDNLLSKLFSIGVYNALIGSDRSIPQVCNLINKPRTKKEAKSYYKIETDEVTYQAETEDSVSETEIQNILTHYKKLGKNTERYVESFNNIAAQYTDAQLRIITKFLPIGVKAVLEQESPKYQSIMTFGEGTYKNTGKRKKEEKKDDLKVGFIETKGANSRPTKPVVIPSEVNKEQVKKLTRKQEIKESPEIKQDVQEENEEIQNEVNEVQEQPVKKRRGRPKKVTEPIENSESMDTQQFESQTTMQQPSVTPQPVQPKRRGRPKKVVQPVTETIEQPVEENVEENILPGFEPEQTIPQRNIEPAEPVLPGFDDDDDISVQEPSLPGFEEDDEPKNMNLYGFAGNNNIRREENDEDRYIQKVQSNIGNGELSSVLTRDKKVVAFVGTTKAGTSFLINNLADMLSKSGIKTAIIDFTENRNSYYIYTKNEEPLRRVASNCLEKLENGILEGIDVNKNLTVFTSIPNQQVDVTDYEAVISNVVKKYSLVLLDCDFTTPEWYFELAQEIYLVQTMDILTIQPLTAFLRDLQSNDKLEPAKLKIVINKAMRVRGLTEKTIIGGLSRYNNPEMSYMRDLFDRDRMTAITIPFDEETLSKYLCGMVDCYVSTSGYSKQFLSELKKLGDVVYPLVSNKYKPDYSKSKKALRRINKSEEDY